MTILIVIMFITTPAPAIPTWLHIEPGLVEGYCLCSRCKSNENLDYRHWHSRKNSRQILYSDS